MNRSPLRPVAYLFLVLATAVLGLMACSSSDETDPGKPAPTPLPLMIDDLTATAGTNTSVTLGWTSPQLTNKATIRYDLRYIRYGSESAEWDAWTVAAAPESDTSSGQNRSHEVTGLTSGQTYVFRLSASTDGTDWSDASNSTVATAAPAFDTTPPADITGLMLYKSTSTTLTVVWPQTGDDGIYGEAQSYKVWYSLIPITPANLATATPATGPIIESALPDMMETTITGLTADQEYFVVAIANDDENNLSGLSIVMSAWTVDLQTIYVNVEGTGDYPTIEAAINDATVGDLILVGPGRYTWANQATGDSLHGMIHVLRDYQDFEVRSIAGAEATILDAQFHARVMAVTGGPPADPENPDYAGITIDGFTFTNGKATALEPNPYENWSGGGLNLHLTDTVVRNCIFVRNEATEGGGLWVGGQGDAIIENCLFEDNEARLGGGIMLVNSEPRITVRHCVIRGNHATNAGGGIFAGNVLVTMEELLITGNDSSDKGGGVSFSGLHPDCWLTRCTVADNEGVQGSAVRLVDNMILRIHSSLLAFNSGSAAFSTATQSGVEISCTLIYGHELGNQLPFIHTDLGGNLESDPLFCDRGNYLLQTSSPCLPENHPGGPGCGVIGARGAGCGP